MPTQGQPQCECCQPEQPDLDCALCDEGTAPMEWEVTIPSGWTQDGCCDGLAGTYAVPWRETITFPADPSVCFYYSECFEHPCDGTITGAQSFRIEAFLFTDSDPTPNVAILVRLVEYYFNDDCTGGDHKYLEWFAWWDSGTPPFDCGGIEDFELPLTGSGGDGTPGTLCADGPPVVGIDPASAFISGVYV
jgi:hypothetical protein